MRDMAWMFLAGLIGWAVGLVVALVIATWIPPDSYLLGMVIGGALSLSGWAFGALIYIEHRYPSQ